MKNIYQSLLLLIAGSTQKQLARQIKYLKVENQILRSKLPLRITIHVHERRRLAKFARGLGGALQQLATSTTGIRSSPGPSIEPCGDGVCG